jgi:hypothetical protein
VPVTTALGSNADEAEEVIESGACPLLAQSGPCRDLVPMSAFGGKAGITWTCAEVRS